MARSNIFEFEDFEWFPSWLRNYMTDFLQHIANTFDFYKGIIPVLEKGLKASKTNQIVDLASGGGGGWKSLSKHVEQDLPGTKVLFTDFFPNEKALKAMKDFNPEMFDYSLEKVDASNVPSGLKGMRTQFLSLHHFNPENAQKILQNAVDANTAIACFEAQKRSVGDFIKFFFSPINVMLLTPFIKPFSIGRIFFTYIIPLVPLFVWWDGLASVLRTYSEKELKAMVKNLENTNEFKWEIDHIKNGPTKIYYIFGYPLSNN